MVKDKRSFFGSANDDFLTMSDEDYFGNEYDISIDDVF